MIYFSLWNGTRINNEEKFKWISKFVRAIFLVRRTIPHPVQYLPSIRKSRGIFVFKSNRNWFPLSPFHAIKRRIPNPLTKHFQAFVSRYAPILTQWVSGVIGNSVRSLFPVSYKYSTIKHTGLDSSFSVGKKCLILGCV